MAGKTPADLRLDLTEFLLLVKEAHLAAAKLEQKAKEIEDEAEWWGLSRYGDAAGGAIHGALYDVLQRDHRDACLSETAVLGFDFDGVASSAQEALDIIDLAIGAPEVAHVS